MLNKHELVKYWKNNYHGMWEHTVSIKVDPKDHNHIQMIRVSLRNFCIEEDLPLTSYKYEELHGSMHRYILSDKMAKKLKSYEV
jgi:hypothetical protein